VLQSLLFPALWPAYAEARARGDSAWIRRTYSMTMKGALALNVTFAVAAVMFGQTLIRLWAGRAAVPPRSLLLAMAGWSVISGCMTVQSCLLAALNRTRLQAALSMVAAALNLGISIALVTRIGSLGVILGTILSYALVLVIPQTLTVTRALQELSGDAGEPKRARLAEVSECGW
jgi:O-antigen/teichoic acid export membrane protein